MYSYTRSVYYQTDCFLNPIVPSIIGGGMIAGFNVIAQGVPLNHALNPQSLGTTIVGIYVYNAMQCPMEAIHGKQSLLHNFLSAGILGYVGVSRGLIGSPFQINPSMNPATSAFIVYGSIAAGFGALGGKPL